MISLSIQSFGQEKEYRRAILTILSFYTHSSIELQKTKTLLFTDRPEYFKKYLAELPVSYIQLTPEKITEMRGAIDFLHRIKIALIDESFQMEGGPLFYVDSDTFFISDPGPIIFNVTPRVCYMHKWEYEFESLKYWTEESVAGRSFKAFYKLIKNCSFLLADGSPVRYNTSHASLNAGAMLFHADHKRFLADVYALTDQFYPLTQNHASEQYAFSLIMQTNTDVKFCEDIVYHYWYRVKKQIIDIFLAEKFSNAWSDKSLSNKLSDVKLWTNKLPKYFEVHILMKRDKAIQAFNEGKYKNAYKFTLHSLCTSPLSDMRFIKDVLYHSKRRVLQILKVK
jgi:hypothetical protein